jgi:hypothetical protein
MSKFGTPASSIDGKSGTSADRPLVVTASARRSLLLTCGSPVSTSMNIMVMRPPSTSLSAGGELLYGTCRRSIPACFANVAPDTLDDDEPLA